MPTPKTEAEWDRIELEYLQGEVSVREIADRFSISDTAIRKRAKKEGWVRAVRRPKNANFDEPAAERAPRAPAEPVEHGEIAERGRQLVARMLDELDATTTHLLPTVREFEDFLREAGGFSKSLAAAVAAKATPHLRGEPEAKADDAFWTGLGAALSAKA